MRTIEAVVENGAIRTLEPLNLADGTKVQVQVPEEQEEEWQEDEYVLSMFDPEETKKLRAEYAELEKTFDVEASKRAADRIAALPSENTEPFSGEDHDEELYGWKKSK